MKSLVPASSLVPLPDSISDDVAAHMLINTVTALTAIRAAHDSLPPDARTGVVVLLTGAGSAVGRLIGKVLTERGVKVISLVRSEAGVARLASILPGSPVFATDIAGLEGPRQRRRRGRQDPSLVAIDSVGGRSAGRCCGSAG